MSVTPEAPPHTPPEVNDFPGVPYDSWNIKVDEDGREMSVTDPDGESYALREGERFVLERNDQGEKQPYIISPEGVTPFEEWGPKIVADNIEKLGKSGEVGQHLIHFYTAALAEDPRLEQVRIFASGSAEDPVLASTGGFARHRERTKSGHYELRMNTQDGWNHYEKLLQERPGSSRISARKLGIPPKEMDAKTLAGFIFAHELGHVVDYTDNAPDLQTQKERRLKELSTLPWPGWDPARLKAYLESDEGKTYWTQNQKSLESKGIPTPEELLRLQEAHYRALETEDNPDQFAVRVIHRVWAEEAKHSASHVVGGVNTQQA